MKKKSRRRKGLRAIAYLLSMILFFSTGMLAGIYGERSGLFGGKRAEPENDNNAAVAESTETAAGAETPADGTEAEAGTANDEAAGDTAAGTENASGEAGTDPAAGTDGNAEAGTAAGADEPAGTDGAAGTDTAGADGEAGTDTAGSESSADGAADPVGTRAGEILSAMSTEDKVAQLFFVTPDALTGVTSATRAGDTTGNAFDRRPVGGIVLFEGNISDPGQLLSMTQGLTQISMDRVGVIPFIAVDEEGGTVLRVASNGNFGLNATGNMADIGATGNTAEANGAGSYIGSYLADYGINVDFAPVADVLTNGDNAVVRYRSFGSDGDAAAEMTAAYVRGLTGYGVSATLKHFPGHGSTTGDSHKGAAVSYRTLDELRETDLKPFAAGIEAGAEFVMAGHISFPNIDTGEDVPATISHYFLTDILRDEMGFGGIIVTDAMNMQAITDYYSSGDAAIRAINAGADMILMPASFGDAYSEVLTAVMDGRISMERLDESVLRILRVKLGKTGSAE